MSDTTIEWTDATWNPVAGCAIVTAGCSNCYAMRMAARLEAMGVNKYKGLTRKTGGRAKWTGRIRCDQNALSVPLAWKRPRKVFVNSMSDLFHKEIPRDYVDQVFSAMEEANWHVYQVLTKRSSLMRNYVRARYDGGKVPHHIWLGVSVEDSEHKSRVEHLKQINSDAKFISFEPLLGAIGEIDLRGVAWAIVGGESGPGAREMKAEWATDLRDVCLRDDVAFFFKQWGGARPKSGGRLLDGEEWNGFPTKIVPKVILDALTA